MSLIELLRLNNIDFYKLDPLEIQINDRQLLDTTVLIDSSAKVIPVYKKEMGQSKKRISSDDIVGALIFTVETNVK